MNLLEFHPSLVSIFLTQENVEQIENYSNLVFKFSEKLKEVFPNLKIFVNQDIEILKKYFLDIQAIHSTDELDFLQKVTEKLPPSISGDSDIDEVFFVYIPGIFPLLDTNLTQELLSRHKKYLSQYSYSENLPAGIVPFFISREFVLSLPKKLETATHEYLLKNINNYDVEIFYSPPDLRQYRLNFSLKDSRSSVLVDSLLKENSKTTYKEILPLLMKFPKIFRSSPSYIEIELFRGCDLKCTFCPRQYISNDSDGQYLNTEFLQSLFKDMNEYFHSPFSVCFGGMGEPLLHPEFNDIVKAALFTDSLKELIVETSLSTDIDNLIQFIEGLSLGEKKKLTFIVNLSTLDEKQYHSIYGKNILPDLLKKINQLEKFLQKGNLHVQIIKMKEVENQIENYFNFFEEKQINVILQKYNRYAELMPEKRVSDLTPIKREFCWHLTRDMYICHDGSVAICRQDFQNSIGNLNTNSIIEIWNRGLDSFSNSLHGNHSLTKAPCLQCDEWYTFNA
ncbi:MAG: spiro-SPASM protein [Leptospiraceae bacterium]|nr:spiro-SPASM protein [Leptospiraceae bacterium]MCK6382403.1 spiro-SPASM protein [Leptospiraceae bacterium]NUM42010.1 spiro-SPASM protein [Leptospiraceae bacterium]